MVGSVCNILYEVLLAEFTDPLRVLTESPCPKCQVLSPAAFGNFFKTLDYIATKAGAVVIPQNPEVNKITSVKPAVVHLLKPMTRLLRILMNSSVNVSKWMSTV